MTKTDTPAPLGPLGSDPAIKVGQVAPDLDESRLRQQALGARLRQMFDDVMREPVPEEFLSILRSAEVDRGSES